MSDPRPIGVFDSGVGGLTVLREIIRRTPLEPTLYLGDNDRAPYGTRSDDEVLAFSTQSLDALVERDVKALVVACNTSTAVGLAAFRQRYDLPVLGVVRPGAAAAALATRNRRVGVIATPATIRSHAYLDAIKVENPAVNVVEHATPALVPMVEAGELSGAVAEATIAESLAPLLPPSRHPAGPGSDRDGRPPADAIDTLLLGCTHYPLLRPLFVELLGDDVAIVEFGDGDGLGARRAAERQPTRGTGRDDAIAYPDDHRRPRPVRGGRWPPVRAGVRVGRVGGARSARRMSGKRASDSWRDDRAWQAGILIGSALGAAATLVGRQMERRARQGLVDWATVERLAIGRLVSAPGALSAEELRASEPEYAAAMDRIVPALSEALGTELPGVVERSGVVDRAGWVRANTASFASLIGKLEHDLLDQVVPAGGGFTVAAMALANRWITTRQLGVLLGFMGQRVLGQYDLALLSAEAAPGRLLFVEENIRQTARALGVPLASFRTWIALHETTHAFEFEAHPWLRPYLASRLERQLTLFGRDVRGMGQEAMKGLGRALRGEGGGEHWMERLMTDEQKALFRETQAVMSLLEGFSDYVMDEVGQGLVPDVETIRAKFDERRTRRTPFERAMLRLTGMDLKLDQYKKGELFVRAVADARGPEALRRLWAGPDSLPRDGEIEAPERWIARVLDGVSTETASTKPPAPPLLADPADRPAQ